MTKKKMLLLCAPIFVLFIALPVAGIYEKWQYNHPLSDSKHGFQAYTPKTLPDGQRITDSRISVYQSGGKVSSVGVQMNLRSSGHNWIYSISERRSSSQDVQSMQVKHSNFDVHSVKPTCVQRITTQSRTYRLCHWIDYDRIGVYELKFIEEEVFIRTMFPTARDKVIPMSQLDNYVDSFVPTQPPSEIVRGAF